MTVRYPDNLKPLADQTTITGQVPVSSGALTDEQLRSEPLSTTGTVAVSNAAAEPVAVAVERIEELIAELQLVSTLLSEGLNIREDLDQLREDILGDIEGD